MKVSSFDDMADSAAALVLAAVAAAAADLELSDTLAFYNFHSSDVKLLLLLEPQVVVDFDY